MLVEKETLYFGNRSKRVKEATKVESSFIPTSRHYVQSQKYFKVDEQTKTLQIDTNKVAAYITRKNLKIIDKV